MLGQEHSTETVEGRKVTLQRGVVGDGLLFGLFVASPRVVVITTVDIDLSTVDSTRGVDIVRLRPCADQCSFEQTTERKGGHVANVDGCRGDSGAVIVGTGRNHRSVSCARDRGGRR